MMKQLSTMKGMAVSAALCAVACTAPVRADSLDDALHSGDVQEALRSGYCWETVDIGLNPKPKHVYRGFELVGVDATMAYPKKGDFAGQSWIVPKRNTSIHYRAIPCPEPEKPNVSQFQLDQWKLEVGPELSAALSYLYGLEYQPSGLPTGSISENKGGVGGGAVAMVTIPTNIPNATVKAFASVDAMGVTVDHTYSNGNKWGTTSNVLATVGVKAGPNFGTTWAYGLLGVAALNENLHINFLPVYSSTTTTVAGVAAGGGVAFRPAFLSALSTPSSMFVEYQHVWYQDAHFYMPAASPGFNYTFHREDNLVKLGITFALGSPGAPSSPAYSYPVKAPPLK